MCRKWLGIGWKSAALARFPFSSGTCYVYRENTCNMARHCKLRFHFNCIQCCDRKCPLWNPWQGNQGLSLISAWISKISNNIHYKVWDEITYPFQNFSRCTEIWKWVNSFHFIMDVITYPCGIKFTPYHLKGSRCQGIGNDKDITRTAKLSFCFWLQWHNLETSE